MATTWNASDKSANITLSGGNLTAAGANTSNGGVRSTSQRSSGRIYVEFTVNPAGTGIDTGVGIADGAVALTSIASSDLGAFIIYRSGNIFFNGSATGQGTGVFANGDVIGLAVDFGASLGWFNKNGGSWRGSSSSGNPASGTAGFNIAGLFPNNVAMAVFTADDATTNVTANFGASPFAFTPPAGYSAWDTTAPATTKQQAWTAGNGAGLTWSTLINSADLASLPNGQIVLSSVADIANGTSLDMFMDISIRCQIASSTIVAGASLGLYLYQLLDDGSTYGDGQLTPGTQAAVTPAVPPLVTINLVAAASQTLLVGSASQIQIPPESFRFALLNNSGFALTSGTQTVMFRTYNINLNA